MLFAEGFPPAVAGGALAAYNLGGVFGALICAQAITRFGSRWPMILCALGGAVSSLLIKVVPNDQPTLMMVGFGLHGLFVNAVNCTLTLSVLSYTRPPFEQREPPRRLPWGDLVPS